ncbi:MAG TPA: cation diffusion facilitator family transporter [Bryobacteraceae bacterium]|nr:cation diffusion facilitator family transporter [Bryobacteraceae bacterium]
MQTGQRVAVAGMVVSGALALIKIFAGMMGHSTAVVADGFESAGDFIASSLVLLALTLAVKPADAEHPYGHGRIEILTGLLIGVALAAAGAIISYASLQNLGETRPAPAAFVVWPLVASAFAKAVLAGLKFHYGRKLQSAALIADASNDAMDICSAVSALIAVGLTIHDPVRFLDADRYGGFVVGLIVVWTGVRVARDTALQLMDTMPEERLMNQIRAVASFVDGVRGVEKCFARKTGFRYHVDLHLEVDPEMTVRQSHDIAHVVRQRILEKLDWVADVLVHVEPHVG